MLRRLPKARPIATGTSVAATLPPLASVPPPGVARILDFDSECRPDAYLGSDFTTKAVTGIAARFIGEDAMWCVVIDTTLKASFAEQSVAMLQEFVELYDQADIVTGHNIRRHDLPIISGACVYFGLPPLKPKRTSDTLMDGPKSGLVFSRSQENLGDMLQVLDDKYHMNNARWKRANLLEDPTVTRARVVSDVEMHIQVRAAMVERGLLMKAPKWWRPA